MKQVVKHGGHAEAYDNTKVRASVYAAALGARLSKVRAQQLAEHVGTHIDVWMSHKAEVTSHDLRYQVGKKLTESNARAGYLYAHHRILW